MVASESRSPTDPADSAAAVWDEEAASYDASRRTDPVYSSCVHQVTREVPSKTQLCLDAGCGTGLSTADLRSRCRMVVAVDFSIESSRVLKSKGLPNVVPVQADLSLLPFKDSTFEACVSANTLQHFGPRGAQQRAIAELKRVTKEFGVLCLSVHHYSRSKRRGGWKKEGKPGQPGIDYWLLWCSQGPISWKPTAELLGAPIR